MRRIDPDIWSRLEGPRPTGDRLLARFALPEVTERVYLAIDSEGIRHLLICLMENDDNYRDIQSRGLIVETRELVVAGQIPIRYIDIECRDTAGYSVLDLIGGEIIDGLINSEQQSGVIVGNVLAKWRRFWGNIPQQLLSREEQIGLFAELWFLLYWLLPHLGSGSISAWRGPWGSRHDFEWADKSVEVKATTTSRRRIFHISNLEQLEHPENGPLFLFGMSLKEETGTSNTLPVLINNIRGLISSDSDSLTQFENSLVQTGYSPVHEDQYSKLHLHNDESLLYTVRDEFPRITRENFEQDMLNGIEQIEYRINLNGYNEYITASEPDEIPFLFHRSI